MTKELEALKTIKIKCHPNSNPSPLVDEALEIVEQALQRLESIDNTKPSEALEWLNRFKGIELSSLPFKSEDGAVKEVDLNEVRIVGSPLNNDFRKFVYIIENALQKSQEQEKVLRIIKNKDVDIQRLIKCINVATYNNGLPKNRQLTKEEFDLLKRWVDEHKI